MFEVNVKNVMEEEERQRIRTWLGFSLGYTQYSTKQYNTIQYKYTTVNKSVQFGSCAHMCTFVQ